MGYVLADGMQDEARLDIDQLVIRTLRELDAGHVWVLATVIKVKQNDKQTADRDRAHHFGQAA